MLVHVLSRLRSRDKELFVRGHCRSHEATRRNAKDVDTSFLQLIRYNTPETRDGSAMDCEAQ
jgi:hypothetical protein